MSALGQAADAGVGPTPEERTALRLLARRLPVRDYVAAHYDPPEPAAPGKPVRVV